MKRIPHFHEKRGKSKSGKKWVAYYHVAWVDGKAKWTKLSTDRVEALRKWADLEQIPTPSEVGTFNAVAQQFMTWFKKEVEDGRNALRTYEDREAYLKNMTPVFGDSPFQAIDSATVRTYIDKRSAKITAKKEMRFLSIMWNWAKERGIVDKPNPVAGVRMPKEIGRAIEVKPHEYWLVWECGDQMVKDTLELAARLGTRPTEVFSIEWRNVDLESKPATVKIWQGKVRQWRVVEADEALEALLRRMKGGREQPRGYLLTNASGERLKTTGAFRRKFDIARDTAEVKAKELGIEFQRFQHRDIRPMAGILTLQAEGMDAARRLLGHTTERQTAHYTTKRIGAVGQAAPLRSTSKNTQ